MTMTFIRAIILTVLVIAQAKLTEIALIITKQENLPNGLAILISLAIFVLGIYIYNYYLNRISLKN